MLLLDVISLPINIFGRSRSSPIPLLHKNTTIPVRSSINLSTEVENQEKVNFAIYEGKKLDANYLLYEIEYVNQAP
jgi:molecular chaperone DnaK (HSP70)